MFMSTVLAGIRTKFSDVQHIETEELEKALSSDIKPLLLDCREEEEYAVSRLPGAVHTPPNATDEVLEGLVSEESNVVCYCSVGYRSSVIARRLKELRPAISVANLEGSIFAWANEGRSLQNAKGGETTFVHPYNALWGGLLEAGRRRRTPE